VSGNRVGILIRFLAFLLVFAAICGAFSWVALRRADQGYAPTEAVAPSSYTVVLDAGHGGEDGGAVSAGGIMEKELNLQITRKVAALLRAAGVNVVLTREGDRLLYDRTQNYQGRKKALDLAARRAIAEKTENCVFVSIHMNAYPLSQYRGLQVWYSPNHPHSRALAECLQTKVQESLQPENDRRIKAATSSIYLLHHLECPAILVECGFLSNPEEAEKLSSPAYQRQLAFVLALSILQAQRTNSIVGS
jgi:N-acetylmuramoyl-L-alanine amidase